MSLKVGDRVRVRPGAPDSDLLPSTIGKVFTAGTLAGLIS